MKRILYFMTAFLLYGVTAPAQISPAAMQQWKDRKYSMFIHFGVYSKLGGVWEGKPVSRGAKECSGGCGKTSAPFITPLPGKRV